MPEVIINGPEGRLECRYMPAESPDAPTALILHPEPDKGGTMNNRVTYALYQHFQSRGFAVMRFNFRGVGRSQEHLRQRRGRTLRRGDGHGLAAVADPGLQPVLDRRFSFGSWIGMQLMMRRPEIRDSYR